MFKKLPRILLVSEVAFTKDCRGASRTLLNLFESYPAKHLTLYSGGKPDSSKPLLDQQFFYFPDRYLYNRLKNLLNPLMGDVNLQLFEWLPISNKEGLEAFSPEVILVCPITPLCLIMGKKLSRHFKCPFLIYFMDDWIATNSTWWLSGNVQKLACQLLTESDGWLMISEQLQETLSRRYQITPRQSMVVHNPVDLSGKEPPTLETSSTGSFKIVYAGSIWPMHYDAVAVIAEAVFQLRQDGEAIELVLHTEPYFWNLYQEKWKLWEVTNGFLVPYHELDSYLKRADLLLVASSFLTEHTFMTRSSVQTKITDYMTAGRPILSCGPEYSACNQFINNWNCGVLCETNQLLKVKEFLRERLNHRQSDRKLAQIAFEVIRNNFEKNKVVTSFYEFIKNISKI